MKKLAIVLALVMLQMSVVSYAATKKTTTKKPVQTTTGNVQTPQSYWNGDQFLLKYNVKDLEAAPWLNNGKRNANP